MRRRTLCMMGVAVLGAGGAARWWVALRPLPEPPALDPAIRVDPMVQDLVTTTLDAARDEPRNAELRARLGMVYDAHGLDDHARRAFLQALSREKDRARWWYYLGGVELELGHHEQALDALDHAAALQANYAPIHQRRARALLELGRADEAEAAARRAVETAPDDPVSHATLGRVLIQRDRNEEAVERLRRVLEVRPDYGYARQLLATAYRHLGRLAESRVESARSAGSAPLDNDPWNEEILALRTGYAGTIEEATRRLESGLYLAAVGRLEELRKHYPADAALLNLLSTAYARAQKPERARDVLEIALNANPDHAPTHLNLSVLHERAGDLRRAMIHATRAVEINPMLGSAHRQQGLLFIKSNQIDRAVPALQRAVDLGVGDHDTRLLLGQAQCHQAQFDRAMDTLSELVRLHPESAGGYALLARAEAEVGQFQQAIAHLARARALNPEEPNVRSTAARIRELQSQPGPAQP